MPKKVEDWLNTVDYSYDPYYIPSDFSLEFINFIKLVNGGEGEENKTPVLHYKMLDQLAHGGNRLANMIHRGAAKTTLMGEYLFLYLGVTGGKLPHFGQIELALYISDSIDNGVKNMRKNIEFRRENSAFLMRYIPKVRFTDIEWQFENIDGDKFIVKGYGAKALPLTAKLYTDTGFTTIKDCKVGDYIYSPEGVPARIKAKSEVFNKPMYKINLRDGRSIVVSDDHINSVVINTNPNNNVRYERVNITTKELLKLPSKDLIFIENTQPIRFSHKKFPLDPYVLGLLLGDGSIKKDGSTILHCHKCDWNFYKQYIPYELGSHYVDKRNSNVISQSILGISEITKELDIRKHGNNKSIPEMYQRGSVEQRLSLLQGLMDTDGTVLNNGRCVFTSNSLKLCEGIAELVRSLGGAAYINKHNRVEITLSDFECVRLPRKVKRLVKRPRYRNMIGIASIEEVPSVPSQCIAIESASRQYLTEGYFRTHNTGVRGTKAMGKRPKLAVIDDVVSDEDARSETVIHAIKETIYKAVDYALHPTQNKIIWSGTPYNAKDPLYEAVESGAWDVNVYPVCEKFPCSKEEFKGSWEDRFPYEYVLDKYTKAKQEGKIKAFNQELMLKIMSEEDRLISQSDLRWYKKESLLNNKNNFNFYITTDFATTEKESGDFSVISVWAYNNNGDWFWVDGVCKKQTMDKNINDLFRLVSMYNPISVGIEVTGQQGGFIPWIQQEMMNRNIWFTLASKDNSDQAGIRPNTNKLQRFNVVVPLFKAGKIFFPVNHDFHSALQEMLEELNLASESGFRSKHDDALDTISMLPLMKPYKPSFVTEFTPDGNNVYADYLSNDEFDYSYTV